VSSTRATRWVRAGPDEVYRAVLDPLAVAAWRVPNGMSATIHQFDAREGGRFRISLHPVGADGTSTSTSTEGTQTFHGRFTRLLPGQLVVEAIEFEPPDPLLVGILTITTELREADGGTEVTMVYDDLPDGADLTADAVALQMALVRLAAWVEDDRRWWSELAGRAHRSRPRVASRSSCSCIQTVWQESTLGWLTHPRSPCRTRSSAAAKRSS
jgi:uncharacterized protein YndB with AHSA1/START domain